MKTDSPFLSQVREAIRVQHYSIRTEQAYLTWVRRYINFHCKRHPLELGPDAVRSFRTYLAVERQVAPATQNQALNALVFLYDKVGTLGEIGGIVRARRKQRIPVVLTQAEVGRLMHELSGSYWLIACLQYG